MEIKVCKFGGSSLANREKIELVADIIKSDSTRRCVVLSAPGKAPGIEIKITDMLISLSEKSLNNQDVSEICAQIKNRYKAIYSPLGLDKNTLDGIINDLDKRLASDKSLPARYRDAIVASGEDYNARLFTEYLRSKGMNAVFVSPAEAGMIVTQDYGDARLSEKATKKLSSMKKKCEKAVVIFPGFFGVTSQGHIATFSRGGSDLTGAILADAVDAAEYENWTDVDGIFSASPRLVDSPFQIPALTYKEMRELSYIGFNVFHEEAVKPVFSKKIPIRLRNTDNLSNEGTLIVGERLPSERDVIGIASGGRFCSFTLQKFLMNREKGFGRRLLSIFEEMNLSYEHCPSGVDNISVILDQEQLKPDTANRIIRALEEELSPDEIKSEYDIALIAVVGEGLLHKIGVLGQSANALSDAGINIKMANQGSSEISMIFGIDSRNEKKAVTALYNVFFNKTKGDT